MPTKSGKSPKPRPALYRPLDAALFRTPLLPADDYRALSEGAVKDGVSGHQTEGEHPVLEKFRDPVVQLAMAVGSLSLYNACKRALDQGLPLEGRLKGRLLRYLI